MTSTRKTPTRMIVMLANMPATVRLSGASVNAVGDRAGCQRANLNGWMEIQ
jgi:hypothetical protein